MSCKLSIIVPCYNVEKFVYQCLASIRAQTFTDFEVLCINDGSKDSTLKLIQDFCSADKRFRAINKPNSGYGDSMNIGLSQAKGQFVGIIESDDYIEPMMFEKLINCATEYNLDIARAGFYYSYAEGEYPEIFDYVVKNVVIKPIDNQSVFYQPPAIWGSIYRRSFLLENDIKFLPTPGASFQDTSFAFKCYYKCSRFMLLQNCFVHYRQHENNSVRSDGKLFAVCDEWNEIIRYAKEDQKRFEKVKSLIGELYTNTYKWNYLRLTRVGRDLFIKRWSDDIDMFEKQGISPKLVGRKKFVEYLIIKYIPSAYSTLSWVNSLLKKISL